MRKLIAAILVMIYFLLSASAYSETRSEILFRDIPWGITLDEYVAEIEAQGFEISSVFPGPKSAIAGNVCPEYGCAVSFGDNSFPFQPVCQVGGYDVWDLYINSICDIKDGKADTDYMNSFVYSATYSLWLPEDPDAVVNDLREKLTHLYGPEMVNNRAHSYSWQGENETEVELTTGVAITITYRDKSFEKHIAELNSILYEETENLDGL